MPAATAVKQSNNKAILKQLSQNSPEAFFLWLDIFQPRILVNSRYEIVKLTDKQIDLVHKILEPATDPTSISDESVRPLAKRKHGARVARPSRKQETTHISTDHQYENDIWRRSVSVLCQPRRHGKSSLLMLIILWFFTTRKNFTTHCLGSTEATTRRVMWNPLKKIITSTPKLAKLIPEKNQYVYEMFIPALSNTIQMSPGNSPHTAFGDRLSLLWCSDLHAFQDLSTYNAMLASLMDTNGALNFIDTNIGQKGDHIDLLKQASTTDDGIFFDYVSYKDIDDYCKNAPPWISRDKAKRLQKTVLETEFKRDILGLTSDTANQLFSSNTIELCKEDYHQPVLDIQSLVQNRSYFVGAGLDRSKNLLSGALGKGDATVWTCILKVADPEHGEPIFHILNQEVVIPNTSAQIKKIILKDHKRYGLDNICLESYETMDLASWVQNQQINCELISPSTVTQMAAFPEWSRVAKEGRFRFSFENERMASEMSTFCYFQSKRGGENLYSFGHSSRKFKDDYCYSALWAMYSLRSKIMNLYSLSHINCTSKRKNRNLCFLFGGSLQLNCSETCSAAQKVNDMYTQFLAYQLDSDLLLHEFYQQHVKLVGAKVYQAI